MHDIHQIHTQNYAAMPMALRQEVYEFLKKEFPQDFFDKIRLGHIIYGKSWFQQDEQSFNMNMGLAVRNSLRKAGFSDGNLPCLNWDAVYIPVLEAAAGVRSVLFHDETE